jgi:hypothetical protein
VPQRPRDRAAHQQRSASIDGGARCGPVPGILVPGCFAIVSQLIPGSGGIVLCAPHKVANLSAKSYVSMRVRRMPMVFAHCIFIVVYNGACRFAALRSERLCRFPANFIPALLPNVFLAARRDRINRDLQAADATVGAENPRFVVSVRISVCH